MWYNRKTVNTTHKVKFKERTKTQWCDGKRNQKKKGRKIVLININYWEQNSDMR